MNAVAEQMSSVSMNTDSICTRPCLAGCETSAVAAAFGAEPMPASLEYRPRLMPHMMHEPVKPLNAALKLNASRKILAMTPGKILIFIKMTMSDTRIYSTPMTGTSTPVISVRRLPPPSTHTANSTARIAPMMYGVRLLA